MYKVVPFQARISNNGTGQEVAADITSIIQDAIQDDWEFVQVQQFTAYVAGDPGCFGIGATPGTTTYTSVLIFKK